jgi:hypothetical protein
VAAAGGSDRESTAGTTVANVTASTHAVFRPNFDPRTTTMNRSVLSVLFLASAALAQTHTIVGDIDPIQGTNLFELDCTRIRLVSTTVNLQALHDASRQQDIEYEMQVTDVSTGGLTILNVLTARAVPEQFNMGNLRFGRSETWDLSGPAGATFVVFVTTRNQTVFLPTTGLGNAWFLPASAPVFHVGVMTSPFIQFPFQMPTMPELVGTEFTAQTVLIGQQLNVTLTNPDCRVVRND